MAQGLRRVETVTGGVHSISDTERKAYVDYFNAQLADEPTLKGVLPLAGPTEFLLAVKDGLVFAKLIEKFFPKTVDVSKMYAKPKNQFESNINLEMTLAGAKQLGVSVVNIGAKDLASGTEHLVYGLSWQIIKACLLSQVTKMDLSLLQGDENLPPEQLLLRWFNYHLKNAGHGRVVGNFSSDIQDSENYAVLLGQIAPEKISKQDVQNVLSEKDPKARAELMLQLADRLGCRKFVTPVDVVEGNPRLNLAYVATLFAAYPALGQSPASQLKDLQAKLDAALRQIEELKKERDQLKAELADSKAKADQLANELRNLGASLAQAQADKNTVNEQLAAMQQKLAEQDAKTKELTQQLKNLDQQKGSKEQEAAQALTEREDLKKTLTDTQASLKQALEDAQKKNSELDELRAALEKERAARAAAEQALKDQDAEWERRKREWQDDREKLLKRIKELEEENAMLKARLQEEMNHKFNYAQQVRAKEEELEKNATESDSEKMVLLDRIKQLEEELAKVSANMKESLERANREKEDALSRAKTQKERELQDSERQRNRDLEKVRLLLTGNTKQGMLMKQSGGTLKNWQSRFFVLKDHNLYWYVKEEDCTRSRPKGVFPCEELRIYELEEKDTKRPFSFQLLHEESGKKVNLAAPRHEDMRDWMNEIRLAKKKKMGVSAVLDQKDAPK
jgi:septal ring factor EnvC (AmiA/AmiB activator)